MTQEEKTTPVRWSSCYLVQETEAHVTRMIVSPGFNIVIISSEKTTVAVDSTDNPDNVQATGAAEYRVPERIATNVKGGLVMAEEQSVAMNELRPTRGVAARTSVIGLSTGLAEQCLINTPCGTQKHVCTRRTLSLGPN